MNPERVRAGIGILVLDVINHVVAGSDRSHASNDCHDIGRGGRIEIGISEVVNDVTADSDVARAESTRMIDGDALHPTSVGDARAVNLDAFDANVLLTDLDDEIGRNSLSICNGSESKSRPGDPGVALGGASFGGANRREDADVIGGTGRVPEDDD